MPHLTRRHFLKFTLAASAVALHVSLPLTAFASETPSRKPRAPRMLMIDPGHGGHDPGAIGISGTHEKDVTLDIARRMSSSARGQARR